MYLSQWSTHSLRIMLIKNIYFIVYHVCHAFFFCLSAFSLHIIRIFNKILA